MTLYLCILFVALGLVYWAHSWRNSGAPLAISRRLLVGFGFGLLVFVASSMLSYRSAQRLADTADWVRHTHEVLAKIQKVNSDLNGMQAAVRGFVITGQEEFLTPYREAVRELQDDERMLHRLTIDNPRQQKRLSVLDDHIREWLAFSAETLDLRR